MKELIAPVYTTTGEKAGTQKLNPSVFGVSFNTPLVHQVVEAQRANSRQVLAHTKGRGEVRGGGKKPWRQKGTGRARHGSIRSPLWAGGGVTFGPTKERNYSVKINKHMRQQALRMVLSDKVANEKLIILDNLTFDEAKTKNLANMLHKLPSKKRKTMIVTTPADSALIRASKNITNVTSIGAGSLNVYDLLKNEYIVLAKKLIPAIEKHYS